MISEPFAYLKPYKQLRPNCFLNDEEAENVFTLHFDTMKHCFIDFTQVDFFYFQKAIMSSQGHHMDHHLSDFIPHFFRFTG
jgi:hypothetical protein